MRFPKRTLTHVFGFNCATLAAVLGVSSSSALACAVGAPAPLIGVSGPYGVAAAAIGYGGFLLYKKLKRRG